MRAAPLDLVGSFIELCDEELKKTFEEIVGFRMDEKQLEQASEEGAEGSGARIWIFYRC